MSELHRVTAKNFAATSENKIHEDTVAQQYGFEGGLVPGVTTWAYIVHPVVEAFGPEWLERGTIGTKFVKPVYEGDVVEVGVSDEGEITVTNDSGEVCATGTAALPARTRTFDLADYPLAPLPAHESRPEAAVELLTPGTVLGTLELGFHADRHREYLAQIDEEPGVASRGEGRSGPGFAPEVCHPGFLMRQANYVLSQNVRLGPWIHVESAVQLASLAKDGDRIAVRAKVAEEFERKGNRFVDMDILMVANGERPVLHTRHVAIWKLRPTS